MLKYLNSEVTFREFPDEISLCINITNCPFHCPGCHSPELWEDIGTELTCKELHNLIVHNKGITCIGFMGGNPKEVNELAEYVKNSDPQLKTGFYWGGESIPGTVDLLNFDYIKLGPYIEELGGLDNPNTNQQLYKLEYDPEQNCVDWINITNKFWKNG